MRNDIQTTLAITETGLLECGYNGDLLKKNYSYDGSHFMSLAAFAYPTYDIRTACISVIDVVGNDTIENNVKTFANFGAPILFACGQETVQWWAIEKENVKFRENVQKNKIRDFFRRYKSEFSPDRIYRAKNFGRIDINQQLTFVDAGLMPVLEQEMGEKIAGLMGRVIGILHRECFTSDQLKKPENQRWIFQASFWLLCAKILHNKDVEKFRRLDFNDVDTVVDRINRHYRSEKDLQITTERQRGTLRKVASEFQIFPSLANITTESLSYVYENVLVDKGLRKALGIHATPSYLVDYIVWQLSSWIEKIPQEKRVVFEPTCGHAPFLASSMRLLRFLYKEGDSGSFHSYATEHLMGVELDPFAREIARLSLTLADVPNPNGWQVVEGDVFKNDLLSNDAKEATILLCNPPFENFSLKEQRGYQTGGNLLHCHNKAAEVLWKTIPHMPEGSVFGVILPLGFLDNINIRELRKVILEQCEISEICTLPENVFSEAAHESVVVIGRKIRKSKYGETTIKRVRKWDINNFRDNYQISVVQPVNRSNFLNFNMKIPEFWYIWEFLREQKKLGDETTMGQGLFYKGRDLPAGAITYRKTKFKGSTEGFAKLRSNLRLTDVPEIYNLNLNETVVDRFVRSKETGIPQLLINYAPVGEGGPWRIKAFIDDKGRPFTNRFLCVRPRHSIWSLRLLWAVLNSPFVNAFLYSRTSKRDIQKGNIEAIPLPQINENKFALIERLVADFFALNQNMEFFGDPNVERNAKRKLLEIDATVMQLYDLPPKYEKQILDLFCGFQREGVNFQFMEYYPKNFESYIPLHEYISEEYQRSTAAFAEEWVKKQHSERITKILKNAAEAFDEEEEGDA
jgi:hypothetical protein